MRRIAQTLTTPVRIEFEGRVIVARAGDSVAAALLADGEQQFRDTPVSGAPRGPFCMMGICFECLLEIDGLANRQACMVEVHDGMRVKRQRGAVEIELPRDGAAEREPGS